MKVDAHIVKQTPEASLDSEQFVTFVIDSQTFGIPALAVRDILRQQPLTQVPLAKPEIAGAMNLRGHIVTAIDLRARLSAPAREGGRPAMCVVVEKQGEAFCLIVDSVGDVISVRETDIEPNPGSLQAAWGQIARGVYRNGDELLLLLDVVQLLTF